MRNISRLISTTAVAVVFAFSSTALAQMRPADATGKCKDGTYSAATTKRGACSGHGGLETWFAGSVTKAEAKGRKANTKATVESTVKDAADASKQTGMTTKNVVKSTGSVPKAGAAAVGGAAIGTTGIIKETVKSRPIGTPAAVTAKCKDGSFSHAKQHSGACSGHGGVGEWYR